MKTKTLNEEAAGGRSVIALQEARGFLSGFGGNFQLTNI